MPSARDGWFARVGVEALARLLAEVAGFDELEEHLRRAELVAAEAVVEHAHDAEADVEADEVGELERPHRVVEPDPGAGVDVLGGADALLVGAHRLGEERHQDPVDDEAGPVGRDDDLLAESCAEVADCGLGRVVRVTAADQLDERHDRHRAEEMHPDEAASVLASDRLGEPVDRDRRRVRREDRGRRGDAVDLAPEGRLDRRGPRRRPR